MVASRSKSPKRDTNVPQENNRLKSDPELKGLLKRLDKIKKYKTFNRWKDKFLCRLTSLVYEKGMTPAEKFCNDFDKTLEATVKCAANVTGFIDKGELSSSKKTVKASLSLSELSTNHVHGSVDKLVQLIPGNNREEKRLGYTKYHLGAVLIRQGFHQYITMQHVHDSLRAIGESIKDIADKQQLEMFERYKIEFQRFCDIMADLNLYEIMMKCVQFQNAPDPEESSDEEPMMVEIEVETPDGKNEIVKIEIEPSETVGEIKKAIAEDIGIPPDKQIIKFKGKQLADCTAMGQAGVTNGAKLIVTPLRIPITVKTYDGKEIQLMADPTNYLSDLKKMIETESGVPAPNQELFKESKKLQDDNEKLANHGIKEGAVLYMEPKVMTLKVDMPDGAQVTLEVSPSNTIEQVKEKIERQTGIAAQTEVLKHEGQDMPVDKKLKDLRICDGDTIKCELLQIPLKIKDKNGVVHEMSVAATGTVEDIKKQMEDKTGVPADQQILQDSLGEELKNNGKRVLDAGIKAGVTLFLDAKKMKILLELPDGTKHSLEIDALDLGKNIKSKISKTGLLALTVSGSGMLEVNIRKIFGKK